MFSDCIKTRWQDFCLIADLQAPKCKFTLSGMQHSGWSGGLSILRLWVQIPLGSFSSIFLFYFVTSVFNNDPQGVLSSPMKVAKCSHCKVVTGKTKEIKCQYYHFCLITSYNRKCYWASLAILLCLYKCQLSQVYSLPANQANWYDQYNYNTNPL